MSLFDPAINRAKPTPAVKPVGEFETIVKRTKVSPKIEIPKYTDPKTLNPATQHRLEQGGTGKGLNWDDTVTAIRTPGTTQHKAAQVANQQRSQEFFTQIANVPKALVEQYTKPSEQVKKYEEAAGVGKPSFFDNIIGTHVGHPVSDFVKKAAIRTFAPSLEPFGKDAGQLIALRTIMPKIESGEIPFEVLEEFDVLKKTAPQIVGDVAQAVLTFYSPTVFSRTATSVVSQPVKTAITKGGMQGVEAGLGFGAAQAASSGSTDPGEIASTIGQSMAMMGIFGMITSGAIPVSKTLLNQVADLKAQMKADLIRRGYTPEQAEALANHGGFVGRLPDVDPPDGIDPNAYSRVPKGKKSQAEIPLGKDYTDKGKMLVRDQIAHQQLTKNLSQTVMSRIKEKHGIKEWKNATKEQLLDTYNDTKNLQEGDEMIPRSFVEALKGFGVKPHTTKREAAEIIGDMAQWKDRNSRFFNFFKTIDQKIDATTGKDAGKVKDTLTRPREKAVENLIKEEIEVKTSMRDMLDERGINNKKDRALIMRYGEKRMTLDELKKASPKWKEIVEADAWFRENFDDIRERANEQIGRFYDKKKLIPYRKDYYTHAREMQTEWDKVKAIGGDTNPVLEPSPQFATAHSKFNPFALKRTGPKIPLEDAGKVFEAYTNITLHNIHLTEHIVRHRAVADIVAHKSLKTGDLKQFVSSLRTAADKLAGEVDQVTKGLMEKITGRPLLNAIVGVANRLGKNRIVGNIGSAFMQTAGLAPSVAKNTFVRTSSGLLQQAFYTIMGKNDPALKSSFLLRRYGEKGLKHGETVFPTIVQKGEKLLSIPMEWYEKTITTAIWRASHMNAHSQGYRGAELLQVADEITASIVGARGMGEKAPAFESGILSLPFQFQLEVNSQAQIIKQEVFDKMFKDPVRALQAAVETTVTLWLLNTFYEKTIGRTPLPDPIRAVQDATEMDTWGESIGRMVGEGLSSVPGGQTLASLFPETFRKKYFGRSEVGIYPGGVPIANAVSKAFENPKQIFYDFALPYGGAQLKKITEGASALARQGSYSKDGKLQFPVDRSQWFRVLVFGKYSTEEAKEFFERERQVLTENQTAEYFLRTGDGEDPREVYADITKERTRGENERYLVKEILKKIKSDAAEGFAQLVLWKQEGLITEAMEKDILDGLE